MTTHKSINELIVSQDVIVSKLKKKVEVRKNENLHEDAIIVNRTMSTHESIDELIVSQDAIVSKVEKSVEKKVEVRKNKNLHVILNRTMTTHESFNELIVSEYAIVSKVEVRKNENLHEDAIIVNRTMTTSQGTSYNTKAQEPNNNRKSHCQTCKRDVFNLKRHVMSKRHLNLQQDPNWVPGILKKHNCPMCRHTS